MTRYAYAGYGVGRVILAFSLIWYGMAATAVLLYLMGGGP